MSRKKDLTTDTRSNFKARVKHDDAIATEGNTMSRRRFVQGLAVGGSMVGLGLGGSVFAAAMQQQGPRTLRGTDFSLTIGEQKVNFTGSPRIATTVNGSLPAPTLR